MYYVMEAIDETEIKDFGDTLSEAKDKGVKLEVTILSAGGDIIIGERIIEMINSYNGDIEFIVAKAQSCAFTIAKRINKPVRVLKCGFGMTHKGSWSVKMKDGGVTDSFGEFQIKHLKKYQEDVSFLTEEEKALFDMGLDVYFDEDRLTEILTKKD